MAQFDATDFSSRKLQGRRYTGLPFDSQEAFTSTIDIQSSEVLTDDRYIPTGSLPFSGSSQHEFIVSRSFTDPSLTGVDDGNVLQYYYRHKLTRAFSNDTNRETFYFLRDEPATAATKISSDQLITGSQYTNFISNKNIGANEYATLGAGDAESAAGAGLAYNVVVYKSTESDKNNISSAPVDAGDYVFDYKTGVLSFTNDNAVNPDGGEFIYMSAYRYIGRTLNSQLIDGSLGGGGDTTALNEFTGSTQTSLDAINTFTGSAQTSLDALNNASSSYAISSSIIGTANEVEVSANGAQGIQIGLPDNITIVGNLNVNGNTLATDDATFNLLNTNATIINFGGAATTLNIGKASGTVNIVGSASIAGDLTVQGTVTSIQTENLNVSDQFILLASGSTGTKDGGIIVQSGSNGVGTALYFDANSNRWAVNPANSVNWNDTSLTPKQYVVSVSASAAAPPTDPLDFGTTNEYYGMMHVNTDNGDIYIYS